MYRIMKIRNKECNERKKMNVVKKSYIKKILGIVFFSIVCGLFVSLGWSAYQYCQSDNYRGKVSIDDQCIKCDKNIKTDAESDVYQISEKGGKIIITFSDGAYINLSLIHI